MIKWSHLFCAWLEEIVGGNPTQKSETRLSIAIWKPPQETKRSKNLWSLIMLQLASPYLIHPRGSDFIWHFSSLLTKNLRSYYADGGWNMLKLIQHTQITPLCSGPLLSQSLGGIYRPTSPLIKRNWCLLLTLWVPSWGQHTLFSRSKPLLTQKQLGQGPRGIFSYGLIGGKGSTGLRSWPTYSALATNPGDCCHAMPNGDSTPLI